MNAKGNSSTRPGGNGAAGGYSMIEMLVAIGMAAVISMGLYAVFNAQQRASRSQKAYNELQSTCTFAMDTIKNDLLLAGYEAKVDGTRPITETNVDSIKFEFLDEKASTDPPYDDVTQYTNDSLVRYWLDGTQLKKTVERYQIATSGYGTPTTFVLSDGVDSLKFQYVSKDNLTWDPAVTATRPYPIEDVRAVRISLVCASQQMNAIYANPDLGTVPNERLYQRIALTAEIRPRNIAISDSLEDKIPPATPLTNVGPDGASPFMKVWDEGSCGCLQVKWTSNTDSDIAGYTVYYGLASGSYIQRQRVVHQPGPTQTTTLRNLTAVDTPADPKPYFIGIAAYDKSGNQSPVSAETSADPDPSVRVEAGTESDTAINPIAPPPPTGLTISTPADHQLHLSWTNTYTDCLASPVHGYRIYRSTIPDFAPSGAAPGPGSNCIAVLDSTHTSYLDTGADAPGGELVGCAPYYYKIAVVNCDPSQLTNYTNPGPGTTTTYTAASFGSISGTPTDGSRTASPTLNSGPGWRRIILSLTNPSRAVGEDPDFVSTRIYFSTTGPPVPSATGSRDADGYLVVGDPGGGDARMIPDHGDYETAGSGPHTVNFDHETLETPPGGPGFPLLSESATYYFLALSYDVCMNVSQATDEARSEADQCSDCDASRPECMDAPPIPTNLRVTQGCDGSPLRIEWDYPASNYSTHPDFQGFRVVRCSGAGCIPTDPFRGGDGTVIGDDVYLAPDTFVEDDLVSDGEFYTYGVYAGDCYYQKWLEGLLDGAQIAANDPANNAVDPPARITDLALGFFDRAHVEGDQQTELTAAITAADTTVPVTATAGWTHSLIQIDSELIRCDGVTANSFTGCMRGAEATIAIAHLDGAAVRNFPPAPAVAARTGDLSLVPPAFTHNSVEVGARNTSPGTITLNQLGSAWNDPVAWFSDLLYNDSFVAYHDADIPLQNGSTGSTVVLSPVIVDPKGVAENVPVKLTFLKSDGTIDNSVDMREQEIDLIWYYRNNATGVSTCSREWVAPNPAGIVAPLGPVVGGTSQSAPTWGTIAWPVPGPTGNPLNAIVTPSNSWNNVYTNVHDASGSGIASVRLYYTHTDPTTTEAPAVAGAYPACAPYSMVEMMSLGFSDIWFASIPKWPEEPSLHDDQNVWYFIVAVDNEGNFDREPEAGEGAFQYFQQPEDPCSNTPEGPVVTLSTSGNSVTLDWSASWAEWSGLPPAFYRNTDWTPANDLAGFRVYKQRDSGALVELTQPPPNDIPPTQAAATFTDAFAAPAASDLSSLLNAPTASPTNLSVTDPSVFTIPGKVKIDGEVFFCRGRDASHLNTCDRAQNGTAQAPHASGAAVTQDLLDLETNTYFVRAYDTCPPDGGGPKFRDTSVSEGTCSPQCYIQPQWSTLISPGMGLWFAAEACLKRNTVSGEKIYLHVCGAVDDDSIELTESGDSGWFYGGVDTALYTGGPLVGGNVTLMVNGNDTIRIGGFSTTGTWADSTCTEDFGCGEAQTVNVVTDVCATDHTPATPTNVTATAGGSCLSTKALTLSWSAVTPPPGCTTFEYKAYYCSDAGCTPSMLSPITGFTATCNATTCTSGTIAMGGNLKNAPFRFTVAASCEVNNCINMPTVRNWDSGMSSPVTDDPCP